MGLRNLPIGPFPISYGAQPSSCTRVSSWIRRTESQAAGHPHTGCTHFLAIEGTECTVSTGYNCCIELTSIAINEVKNIHVLLFHIYSTTPEAGSLCFTIYFDSNFSNVFTFKVHIFIITVLLTQADSAAIIQPTAMSSMWNLIISHSHSSAPDVCVRANATTGTLHLHLHHHCSKRFGAFHAYMAVCTGAPINNDKG